MNHNIALSPREQRDDIELEKRAAGLIKKVKLGHITKFAVKSELAAERNPEIHAKFKAYLNRYRVMR